MKYQKLELNPSWRGGIYTHTEGYKMLMKPDHPFADARCYVMEHRLIMEKHLGRYLSRNELVHHIDENIQNNDISNLQIMTPAEHTRHHFSKDMNNIHCVRCGADTTYMDKKRITHGLWYHNSDGEYICGKCYGHHSRLRRKIFSTVLGGAASW